MQVTWDLFKVDPKCRYRYRGSSTPGSPFVYVSHVWSRRRVVPEGLKAWRDSVCLWGEALEHSRVGQVVFSILSWFSFHLWSIQLKCTVCCCCSWGDRRDSHLKSVRLLSEGVNPPAYRIRSVARKSMIRQLTGIVRHVLREPSFKDWLLHDRPCRPAVNLVRLTRA